MTSPSKPLVSVIVPAKDEAGNVGTLFRKIQAAFASLKLRGEIVFVDDGSRDSTWQEALKSSEDATNVVLIRHRKNYGLTEALNTGLSRGNGAIKVIMCADLQSDPEEDIPLLVSPILRDEADMVCGWRQGRKEGKVFMSGIYNRVTKWLFGVRVHDQNWVKAFRTEVFEGLMFRSDWHRFLVPLASSKGYRITEVKTKHHPRTYGRSKFGIMRISTSFMDVISIKFLTSFLQKPMFFFGTAGFASLGLGGLLFLLGLATHNRGLGSPLQQFEWMPSSTTDYFAAAILLVIGVQLVSLGFMGELFCSLLNGRSGREVSGGQYREVIVRDGSAVPAASHAEIAMGSIEVVESPRVTV